MLITILMLLFKDITPDVGSKISVMDDLMTITNGAYVAPKWVEKGKS